MRRAWAVPGGCAHCRDRHAAGLGKCVGCGRSFASARVIPPDAAELPDWAQRILGRWLRGKDLHEIALRLACIPILVAFPLLGLAMFAIRFCKTPDMACLHRWRLVLIAAVLNIAISGYLLSQISGLVWSVGLDGMSEFWRILIPAPPAPQGGPPFSA